jgi:hypothetical protein
VQARSKEEFGGCGNSVMGTIRKFGGNVKDLLDVSILTPLSEFQFALRPLTTHLQSIGHGWCVLTGARQLNDGVPDNAIRACIIIWAEGIDAAITVSRCEDNPFRVDWAVAELPPVHFFAPKSTGWTYGEIVTAGRGKLMECAVYGSDGKFQFKELWFKNSKLYFRSRRRKRSELPIAVSLC